MPCQRIEQFGIRRRVRIAHIILRFDQPAVEKMFPIAIHQRAGKERVVLRGQPISQGQPGIIVRREIGRRSAQAGRFDCQFGLLVRGGSNCAFMVNNFFARLGSGLSAHRREECAKTVIIILAPFLERMMMTLAHCNRCPRKSWAVSSNCTFISRTCRYQATGGLLPMSPKPPDSAHESVVRFVLREAVPNPGIKRKRSLLLIASCVYCAAANSICWQNCPRNPALQELVDPLLAFFGSLLSRRSRVSSGVGRRPAISIVTRRRKVASSQTSEGGIPTVFSFLKTRSSIKFLEGGTFSTGAPSGNSGAKNGGIRPGSAPSRPHHPVCRKLLLGHPRKSWPVPFH